MKKIILLLFAVIIASCGPHMYSTNSSGKENESFIIVLTQGPNYNGVTLNVDGKDYIMGKVYKTKAERKAHSVVVAPGNHKIKVTYKGETLVEQNVIIGLRETKKIILR
ncbi:MAG: hypothetical protein LKM37_05535 [Bacteroidales bacterium]|jgi:hypothetical protein|nr:hypothetical protein [Bacteroidales bacterium]MCI1733967.1 hypothetical protein [Bacteroidales bacterium]